MIRASHRILLYGSGHRVVQQLMGHKVNMALTTLIRRPAVFQVCFASTGVDSTSGKTSSEVPIEDMVDEDLGPTKPESDVDQAERERLTVKEVETMKGSGEHFGFQAETKQLLDIVARSLYTEKEIFIRELISNASDALEKRRHLTMTDQGSVEATPEEYHILLSVDEKQRTFSIQDNGVGMTKEELVQNLGTIARSGSKAFLQQLKEKQGASDVAESIIGQFGVGFYSAFMCATNVRVYSRSCSKDAIGYCWESDGSGEFTIAEAEGVAVGTKIIIQLKEVESQFSSESVVERVIKKYSNFVGFPIYLNAKRVNTVDAVWRKSPTSLTDQDHEDFFKFISGEWEAPLYRLHYRVDAPVNINAIFYIPQRHTQTFGIARLENNISLYSRRILIKHKAKDIVPEWMRFVHGVVDSEDLPLNISRESTQDSAQIRKVGNVLTKRILKWMEDEAKKDSSKYLTFFQQFGDYLKEGVCTDPVNKKDIAKLLRFESSKSEGLVSLDEYIARMPEGQEKIYFLSAPSRQIALSSPYYEQFRRKNVEVLFMYKTIDDYVASHLLFYQNKRLYSIEGVDTDLNKVKTEEQDESNEDVEKSMKDLVTPELNSEQCKRLNDWFAKVLGERLDVAKPSKRLSDSPAVVAVTHDHAAHMRMARQAAAMQGNLFADMPMMPQILEYNPRHDVIKKLYYLSRKTDSVSGERSRILAEQVFDNALIAAGLLSDPRTMLGRLSKLMASALSDVEEKEESQATTTESEEKSTEQINKESEQ